MSNPLRTSLLEQAKRPFWKTWQGALTALLLAGLAVYAAAFLKARGERDAMAVIASPGTASISGTSSGSDHPESNDRIVRANPKPSAMPAKLTQGSVWKGSVINDRDRASTSMFLAVTQILEESIDVIMYWPGSPNAVYYLMRVKGQCLPSGELELRDEKCLHGGFPEWKPGCIVGSQYKVRVDGGTMTGTATVMDPSTLKMITSTFTLVLVE